MIDIHCHVLWGVDDASQDRETTKNMLQIAVEDGIEAILCTPHSLPYYKYENDAESLKEPFAQLQALIAEQGWNLEVKLGCEFFLTDASLAWIRNGRALTLNGSRRLLIEFPWYQKVQLGSSETELLEQVFSQGYEMIIAHPERYKSVQEDFSILKRWRAMGCDFQVNRTSLILNDDQKQCELAWRMVEEGYCDAIGTDAHHCWGKRVIKLSDIQEEIERRYDHQTALLLCHENGTRLIAGEPLVHRASR